jgi:hypothetical protein
MRNIDKTTIFSTKYKHWEENLGDIHESYESTKYRELFYKDVVMNLYHCQKGVCAYTEILLCDDTFFDKKHWQDGKYIEPTPFKKFGQLDHFDAMLKKEKGWLWENFFMTDNNINHDKNTKKVYSFLKPDVKDYSPNDYFEYDEEKNRFTAHSKYIKENEKYQQIYHMIDVLGLNHDTIVKHRKIFLKQAKKAIEFGIHSWENYPIEQFFTAFEMIKPTNQQIK